MISKMENILSAALKLPLSERVLLVQQILESFKSEVPPITAEDSSTEPWDMPEFWAQMQKRMDEIANGKEQGIAMEEAFKQMREAIK